MITGIRNCDEKVEPRDEWISIGPGDAMTEKQLSDWQQEIEGWCNENLSEDFFCDWGFGAAQGSQADWYLSVKFGSNEDKVLFVLRWG